MDPGPLNLILFGLLILAGFMIYDRFLSKEAHIKRKIKHADGKRIADFKDGETARLVGEVQYLGKTLRAPLSGRKCVYYYVKVEEKSGGRNSTWSDLIEESKAADVILKDGNHYAYVKTHLVKSHLISDANYTSGFLDDATPELEKFLSRHSEKSEGFLGFNRTLRYEEGILEEGELVAVLGMGKWKSAKVHNFKVPAQKILVLGPEDEQGLYFTDDPEVAELS
jgi:hypothetical protein